MRVQAVGRDANWNVASISLRRTEHGVLLGFVIALAISLTGVGAGSMTTPLLILLLTFLPRPQLERRFLSARSSR